MVSTICCQPCPLWLQVLRPCEFLKLWPHVLAMGKRLRSLASQLWDTDDVDTNPASCIRDDNHGAMQELQLENQRLKDQVSHLLAEVQELKSRTIPPTVQCQQETIALKECWKEPWIQSLRQDVIHLPRLQLEILPQLLESGYCQGKLSFDLPRSRATASQVTKHAENSVSKISCQHPAVFKIGITANPIVRWEHHVYGYALCRREKWQGMKILSITSNSFSAALLESFLISKYRGTPGCRNENPGGETASPVEGPHFTYVVQGVVSTAPHCEHWCNLTCIYALHQFMKFNFRRVI